MKKYTETQIRKEFSKFSKNKQIEILWDALDYMQQYNGRSRFLCVALAMGYDNTEGEHNTYTKIER